MADERPLHQGHEVQRQAGNGHCTQDQQAHQEHENRYRPADGKIGKTHQAPSPAVAAATPDCMPPSSTGERAPRAKMR